MGFGGNRLQNHSNIYPYISMSLIFNIFSSIQYVVVIILTSEHISVIYKIIHSNSA